MPPIKRVLLALLIIGGPCAVSAAVPGGTAASTAVTPTTDAPSRAAALTTPAVQADLRQLMRGIFFPNSNVIFAAQEDPERFPKADDPSVSPNPLTGSYGGWQAVENASLAIAEATRLLALPGRMCSSHHPVPVRRADWQKYTRELREAAMTTYKAAQTKSTDAMLEASDTLSQACMSCHEVYREKENKGGDKNRCLP